VTDPPPCPDQRRRQRRLSVRWRWAILAGLYLVALGLSHLVSTPGPATAPQDPPSPYLAVEVEGRTAQGNPTGPIRIAMLRWPEGATPEPTTTPDSVPVVLLHGSPGSASSFRMLGPELALRGYRVVAPDLPGYAHSSHALVDYSPRAQARAVLAAIDELGIDRAHVVGWSIGGAVALHLNDLDPSRARSLTLLASIGAQETEGSGDYHFEHAKYALGYAALVVLPEALPHFGILGPRWMRHTFIRNFLDMDQRPLGSIMARTRTPTLILHGIHDPLVAHWAADHHHAIMSSSRLVKIDASHFLPVLQPGQTADRLADHFARAESGTFIPGASLAASPPTPPPSARPISDAATWLRWRHWTIQAAILASLALIMGPSVGFAFAAFMVARVDVDLAVASTAMVVPLALRRQRARRTGPSTVVAWAWIPFDATLTLVLAVAVTQPTTRTWMIDAGAPGLIAGVVVVAAIVRIARSVWTLEGRSSLLASWTRIRRHEYWPAMIRYATIVPTLVRLAIRHRGVLLWTRANPGIDAGGGVIEESKADILDALDHARGPVLRHATLEPDPDPKRRADTVLRLIATTPGLDTFPVIVKPDIAEKGRGVCLVHKRDELEHHLQGNPERLIIQQYHPGPSECGIFWIRDASPDPAAEAPNGRPVGSIFSVTRKHLPTVVGDGRSTLRQLVLRHPRHRCLASTILPALRARWDDVPRAGETVVVSHAANHARGARFSDAPDLMTPELTDAIDRIACGFHGREGGTLDFGRFDVRYENDEALIRGQGLAIVELNGTLSESINIYDSDRPFRWARRVMIDQWTRLFEIGARRRALGTPGIGLRTLAWLLIAHHGPSALRARASGYAASARNASRNNSGTPPGPTSTPSS